MKKTIYFAHANGFPGNCYRKLYGYLEPAFNIAYLDTIGHHDNYPVTDNWGFLVQELIQNIEQQFHQPIIGVGHSLGGVLHFIASRQRPELYEAVVMLDSPVLGRMKSIAVRLMKLTGSIDKITPAARTRYRKQSWANTAEAIDYLKDKKLFADFDPDCLSDYVLYGMDHRADGVHLRFEREIEYHIYRTLPHNLGRYRRGPKVPTGLLYGKSTNVIVPSDIHYMEKRLDCQTLGTVGGHLFPFEHPEQAARDLTVLINTLLWQGEE